MKRFGIVVAGVVLAWTIGGCGGGGVDEGPPKDGPMEPQTQDFKNYMKENAGKMAGKGMARPKATPPGSEGTGAAEAAKKP